MFSFVLVQQKNNFQESKNPLLINKNFSFLQIFSYFKTSFQDHFHWFNCHFFKTLLQSKTSCIKGKQQQLNGKV